MSMRKRRTRAAIKTLGANARTRKAREAAKASAAAATSQGPSAKEEVNPPVKPLTFLEAYESAQKRISDLASHRERVLAEISQPATFVEVPRPERPRSSTKPVEDAEPSSSTRRVARHRSRSATTARMPARTVPSPEVQPTPTTDRISARLRSRRSEATLEAQNHDRMDVPVADGVESAEDSDSASPQEMELEEASDLGSDCESDGESEEESEELAAMRHRVNEMGDGLIQAGKFLQEQAWTADATWIMETIKRADRPGSSGELHAILFSRSKRGS